MEKVKIFDTTLRDGEQSAGASMSVEDKLLIARNLDLMKVDIIEAGFPYASKGDFDAVSKISKQTRNSSVCGLARANFNDIDCAGKALKGAKNSRIHTFISTSELHMKFKLKMEKEEVLEAIEKSIKRARRYTNDIEWSPEDASRTKLDFLYKTIELAIKSGATTINIPDTVGYAIPQEFGKLISNIKNNVVNIDKATISVHCHNDLGLAVANSLSAVNFGARQVECTINGLGERAGNASLEELAMALKTRNELYPVTTSIDPSYIVPISKLVSSITGFPVQPNKAIVGANAFAHESGIHQDGVLKMRETYEIMKAEDVGWTKNKLSLGKLSGRAAFAARIAELDITLDDKNEFERAFKQFKNLADKKREIFDQDLQTLISDVQFGSDEIRYSLIDLEIKTKLGHSPEAKIIVGYEGQVYASEATGDGAVDAIFNAIEKLVNSGTSLKVYSVNAVTQGTDSLGEVSVRLQKDERIVNGQGADTDILIASAKAYLNALTLMQTPDRVHPQFGGI